ncbi:hypothetical protein [Ilumatobacter sp.]|uniref:hypothetical protein n=1 Tax=Ilumatobacter sp. TaxID=1967498 RepID=UPI003C5F64A2
MHTTTTDGTLRTRRRAKLGRGLAVAALPLLFATAACTRVAEPDASTPEDSTPATAAATSADTDPTTPTAPDTEPADTNPPDTSGDTSPDTEPDTTDPSTPGSDTTDPLATESIPPETTSSDGSDSAPADDIDDSKDPTAVTIAGIIGAGLLLLVATLWMVRMNRSNDDEPTVDDEVGSSDLAD